MPLLEVRVGPTVVRLVSWVAIASCVAVDTYASYALRLNNARLLAV